MAKKQLTALQKKNKYRALQYTTYSSEFLSILTPFIVMGGIHYQEWFVNEDGWKVGLGGALALALLGIAVFLIGKKKEDEKITNGYISLILGWYCIAFIFVLLSNILDQMATIMLVGGLGLMGAFGLDITSKNFQKKADTYKAKIEQNKEEEILEEIKQEKNKKIPID